MVTLPLHAARLPTLLLPEEIPGNEGKIQGRSVGADEDGGGERKRDGRAADARGEGDSSIQPHGAHCLLVPFSRDFGTHTRRFWSWGRLALQPVAGTHSHPACDASQGAQEPDDTAGKDPEPAPEQMGEEAEALGGSPEAGGDEGDEGADGEGSSREEPRSSEAEGAREEGGEEGLQEEEDEERDGEGEAEAESREERVEKELVEVRKPSHSLGMLWVARGSKVI